MDLMNNRITVAQLMGNQQARAVLQKRFGKWLKHPMVQAAGSLTLAQVIELARVYVPQKTIEETLQELKGI